MSVAFVVDIPEKDSSRWEERDVHESFSSVIQDGERETLMELQERAPHTENGPDPLHNLISDTMSIIDKMPSRAIGRSEGDILCEYYNRTVRRRQSKKRSSRYAKYLSTRPILPLTHDPAAEAEEEHQKLLVSELQMTSGDKRVRLLKSFPLSLLIKKKLRNMTLDADLLMRSRNDPRNRNIVDTISMVTHSWWLWLLSAVYKLRLWHTALKQIAGQFGSSILSYFLFLKSLLGLNTFMSLLCLFFIVVPQAANPPGGLNPPAFTSLDLLTGAASLMRNCRSPRKPWRASHMSTVFLTLLCFPSFLGASVFLSYTVWTAKPSDTCGPFRNLSSMYEAWKVYVKQLQVLDPRLCWVSLVHHYLWENPLFIYVASAVLLVVTYFHLQMVNGQRQVIQLLNERISNEGEDKRFLIKRLHSFYIKPKGAQRTLQTKARIRKK